MTVREAIDIDSMQQTLREEMTDLRHALLPAYLGFLTLLFGGWLLWVLWDSPSAGLLDVAWVLIAAVGYLSLRLHARHYLLASWLLLIALIALTSVLNLVYPSGLTLAVAVLAVIIANALLGAWHSLLAALLSAGVLLLLHTQTGYLAESPEVLVLAPLLYLLVWGAVTIGHQPFREAIDLALTGWDALRESLIEARDRRGELYRVFRALEEATYRIERANNELMLARQQADVARANKARFAATVSHELRGPLNLILGFSRLMALSPERYGVLLPSEYRADVDTIYSSSQHLVSLLDDVLDLSQVEAEHMPLVKDRVDLEQVAGDAIRVVRPLAERKGLYLQVHLPADGLPTILADRVRLRQIMLNLLTNAVRFTQQGGITVEIARHPDSVLFSIQDTGRGISSEELPRLFEEFSQLHLAEEDSTKGTGLGLAISKHLIELHGGRIWAESKEGVGTKFSFTLPLPETVPVQLRQSRRTDSPLPARPHDVCLVLHEDPAIVRLLARYLEGYHVIGVPREHDLLPLVHDYYPRAVVAPPPAAEHIRAALAMAQLDVPVISCSMPQLTQGPQVEGALSYLMKPVTREMVEATIRQVQWDGEEMSVLIVDDDPDTVRLLEIMLTTTPEAPRVWKAYDGHQALEIMHNRVPDLIFIDLLMPGLDGERTIAQMRADPRLRAVPVVVVSARDMVGDTATLGTHIGVYSQRPVSIAEGVKRLQALLDTLTPRYLPEAASDAPSPAVSLG